MILNPFRKSGPAKTVSAVYSAIVAQSRRDIFYAQWGVPDTLTGRFDMISLHLALMFRRLRKEGEGARDFSQQVFDYFFKDMDRSLREMGVGDLSVGKKITKMGSVFYGLLTHLAQALDAGDRQAVRDVIARNVYAGDDVVGTDELTDYVCAAAARLEGQGADAIKAGDLDFGEPQ